MSIPVHLPSLIDEDDEDNKHYQNMKLFNKISNDVFGIIIAFIGYRARFIRTTCHGFNKLILLSPRMKTDLILTDGTPNELDYDELNDREYLKSFGIIRVNFEALQTLVQVGGLDCETLIINKPRKIKDLNVFTLLDPTFRIMLRRRRWWQCCHPIQYLTKVPERFILSKVMKSFKSLRNIIIVNVDNNPRDPELKIVSEWFIETLISCKDHFDSRSWTIVKCESPYPYDPMLIQVNGKSIDIDKEKAKMMKEKQKKKKKKQKTIALIVIVVIIVICILIYILY